MPLYKKILIGLGAFVGAVIVLFVLLFAGVSLYTSGLKKPIEDQLAAIRAEDMATAYSYTTNNFQNITSLDAFKKFVNEYSGFRNNESISYDERKIDNGVGTVNARLKSRSGSETSVVYKLNKEHNQWRIESIVINVGPNAQSSSSSEVSPQPAANPAVDNPASNNILLNKVYHDPVYKYEINYPEDWRLVQEKGRVIINGKEGTPSAQSTFLVQAFRLPRKHLSVQQIMNSIKESIAKDTANLKIIEEGAMPSLNPRAGYDGRYVIYSYSLNNKQIGHLEVVALSGADNYLYVLDYVSSASQFESDLPIAKAMIISFAYQK